MKKVFMAVIMAVSLLMLSSMAMAAVGASGVYMETDLGSGWWQYDYTLNNTSDDFYLYSVYLDFAQETTFVGLSLPEGWEVDAGEPKTLFAGVSTFDPGYQYDIAPGGSLGGFSFKVDYKAGNLPFNAEFDNHQGNFDTVTGTTAVAPEPVSSMLFLAGGAMLGIRRYLKK
ncbi:MAG: hypothetical protein HZA14_01210 [Nitrospirae bacterium]|nr:hypothetical protein [Nitrospirota bacterium]